MLNPCLTNSSRSLKHVQCSYPETNENPQKANTDNNTYLITRVNDLQSDVSELKDVDAELKVNISAVTTVTTDTQTELAGLQSPYDSVLSSVLQMREDNIKLRANISHLDDVINALLQRLESLQHFGHVYRGIFSQWTKNCLHSINI